MNSTLSKVITFAAGAAVGSAVTWMLVKTKYERIANEEIAEMREYVRKKTEPKEESEEDQNASENEQETEPAKSIVDIPEIDKAKYVELTMEYLGKLAGPTGSPNYEEKGGAEDVEEEYKPHVIMPEDFGEFEDYDVVTLTYYSDGIVEDDQCNIMSDPEEFLGEGFADHFGEYEEETVYVRNDKLKIDYEILLDISTYAEANSIGSHGDDE